MGNRVVHFEIHAADPLRAAKFYKDVFNWEIGEWVIPGVKMEDKNRYWLVKTGPDSEMGINGGMAFRQGPAPKEGQPVSAYVCVIGVENVDESVKKVAKAGGKVTVPKMEVKDVGLVAYCADTEGNLFGIIQPTGEMMGQAKKK